MFTVYLCRTVLEEGELDIEAESEVEARQKVEEMMRARTLPDIVFDLMEIDDVEIDYVEENP